MPADELKLLPQWVCAKEDKIPLDVFGKRASVIDPRTWDTYENCKASNFPYVGFVLTDSDPYAIIDLDAPKTEEQAARHKKIVETFDSYAETSISGKGTHIIVKGKIPKGVRRDKVEVYSSERYMICTDNALNDSGIENRQDLLSILFEEMDTTAVTDLEEATGIMSDEEIVNMGMRAANAEKFLDLCKGNFVEYPSQSEADFALLSMLAYYTQDNEQVKRLFRMSGLGKRKKAQRDSYLNTALRKIRAKQAPKVDTSNLKTFKEEKPATDKEEPEQDDELTYPPGLVGDLADYIFKSSVRPVKEVGLAAALALFAGIAGRSYNVSGTGLNQYIILLAGTGTGKDGAATGIETVVNAMHKTLPSVERFIGPAGFASGQALLRALDNRASFVSVLGEFGITLQQICDDRANIAQTMLKRVLLDLYSKSGHGKVMRSNVYADSDKNTKTIVSPAVTLLGESTPETFYRGIEQSHIAEGLIPRFTVITYKGDRPARNRSAFYPPSDSLIKELVDISTRATQLEQNYNVTNINIKDAALSMLDQFDVKADREINKADTEVEAQLWNRAHLKALKLAGLIAVGVNYANPSITEEIASWSITFVEKDVNSVIERFSVGGYGNGNVRQENDIREAFIAYAKLTQAQRRSYKVPKKLLAESNVVPLAFLRRRLRKLKAFRNDRRGEINAIKAVLSELCETEVIRQLPEQQATDEYKTTNALFVRGECW